MAGAGLEETTREEPKRGRASVWEEGTVMGRQRVAGDYCGRTDINAWQAQVWKKAPLEEPITWQGQRLGGGTRDGKATRGRSYCGRTHF